MYIWGYQTPVFIPIFSEIFPFLEQMYIWGYQTPVFIPIGSKKNFLFSEIFPFLGNKCTFGGTKLQFLSPSGQKKLHF